MLYSRYVIVLVVFVVALAAVFNPLSVVSREVDNSRLEARTTMKSVLEECIVLDNNRDACYARACEYEPGYLCAEDILDVVVEIAGPEQAMSALHEIMQSPIFAISSDGHLLSHIIGRATSRVFGSSGENFLRCPSDFNNGCFHGFFEHTLPKADSPTDVVISICENMPPDTPPKEKSYCYHGAGHVFMMNESHDLDAAIEHCLKMPNGWPESCWQGVFMENAGEREWELKKKNFRSDDPLYPCNVVEDRFKPECYINHHGYLIRHYSTSWDELVEVCLDAGNFIEPCLGGLGLMLGGEYWIDVVADKFGIINKSHVEKVSFFCNRFPEGYVPICYEYGIPSFLNFGHQDLSQVSHICNLAQEQHRVGCFSRIGSYLAGLVSSDAERSASCASVPEQYRAMCLGSLPTKMKGEMREESSEVVEEGVGPPLLRARRFFAGVIKYVLKIFFHSVSAQNVDFQADEANEQMFIRIKECLTLESGEQRVVCYASLCEYEPGYLCAEDMLQLVTIYSGPEDSMQMLDDMITVTESFPFNAANEGHSLAHSIGRTSAQYLGGGDAFLRCPTSLDYGCQHGFLEHALLDAESPAAAVTAICESLPEIPSIGRPNCYHGSGHGVMMNESYDLIAALAVCDATPDSYSCLTGVMMENATGWVSGRIQEQYPENNSFQEDNPLAPCDTLTNPDHRRTCFRQHMPYLAEYFDYNVQGVVNACLSAGSRIDIEDCVFGFGAYGIYDGIQENLLPGFKGDFMDKIIHMCNEFPGEYRMHCYTPAIDQATVFYRVKQASNFCYKIEERYRQECFSVIGGRLDSLVVDNTEKERECALIEEQYRDICLDSHLWQENESNVAVTYEKQDTQRGLIFNKNQDIFFGDHVHGFLFGIAKYVFRTFFSSVFMQSVNAESEQIEVVTGYIEARECLVLKTAEQRAGCYAHLCEYEPGYLCAEKILTSLTLVTTAKEGMDALKDMTWGGVFTFDPSVAHLLAHIVGRETANRFGLLGDAFLTCPIDFDYGCYHGFLEAGFLVGHTPHELITIMCESMPEIPAYSKVACYHGSGHGLVMHYSYGLYEPLGQCDMLSTFDWQDACWSGVFMENVNGVNGLKTSNEPDNGFRDDNPFAPCDSLEERYKKRCYENIMPYWLESLNYTLEDLVAICDAVEEGYKDECVHSVGAYSIYPGNQERLLGSNFEGNFIDKTIYVCSQFSDEYRMQCYAPAIQQNFVYYNVEVISEFCEKIEEKYRSECWRVIGQRLKGTVENRDQWNIACLPVPEKYVDDCLLNPYRSDSHEADNIIANQTKDIEEYYKVDASSNPTITGEGSILMAVFDFAQSLFNNIVGYFLIMLL